MRPGGLRVAEGDRIEVLAAGEDVHGEGELLGLDEVARGIDQLTHRGDAEGHFGRDACFVQIGKRREQRYVRFGHHFMQVFFAVRPAARAAIEWHMGMQYKCKAA
jgi:hypothetical protein